MPDIKHMRDYQNSKRINHSFLLMCKVFCEVKLSEKDHIFRKTGIIQKEILLKVKR